VIELQQLSVIKSLMGFQKSSDHHVLPAESIMRIIHVQELPMDTPGKTFLVFFQGLFHFAVLISLFVFMMLSLVRGL
jgi:hypothetical protein